MANGKPTHDPTGVCSNTATTEISDGLTICAGTDKRGVIVDVYSYNDNDEELAQLEDGDLGFYYN